MAVLARGRTEAFFGLRPMEPMKDLQGVADLIEEAFARDLDRAGQSALQELRWLSRVKPILWWMIKTNPDHTDFLSGFVWEESDKIVGNITVNRTGLGSRRWLISNVAVSKYYRGRGIARSLMYAAIELVKEYHGASVSLQVRTNNEPAKQLYQSLEFKEISGTTYLSSNRVPKVKCSPLPQRINLRHRDYTTTDARDTYGLACAATPLTVQKEWPLRQRHFRLHSGERINDIFRWVVGGGASVFWAVNDGRRLISIVNVRPGSWRQTHKIELIVHPDWRGYLERPLISRALQYLSPWCNRGITLKHPAYHTEAIEAYKEFGLKETQTLTWLKLDIQ